MRCRAISLSGNTGYDCGVNTGVPPWNLTEFLKYFKVSNRIDGSLAKCKSQKGWYNGLRLSEQQSVHYVLERGKFKACRVIVEKDDNIGAVV